MKRIGAGLLVALALLVLILVGNTLRKGSRQERPEPAEPIPLDAEAAARRLGQAVQFRTISYQDPGRLDPEAFVGLREFLVRAFPRVHAELQREVIDGHSLLYTWAGHNAALPPLVLMAHMDVVPVDPDSEARWTVPPFAGTVRDGFIWGRGTLDDKGGLLAILEAVDLLLRQGHRPRRTVYLAFGHDEEQLGTGARAMAQLVGSRGPRPAFVLDEGLAITEGIMPGMSRPVAVVGMAEKGYATVELIARAEGGHSSMPPTQTAVGILAQALVRLEAHPMPAEVSGLTQEMFEYVGPEMAFPFRLVFANLWLLRPLVRRILLAKPSTAALIRTTTAPTQLAGSEKENVLPTSARAVVNFRIRPGDTVQDVLNHVRRVVDDARVEVRLLRPGIEPVRPSPTEAPAFRLVQRAVRQVLPEAVVAPSLMVGATDSRAYTGLTEHIYRFRPVRYRPPDLARPHGVDERVSIDDHARCIRFFVQLLRGSDAL
ncbi:MAG: M20 family peptidase [Myxococcales bacterium]|nr:M20 family peptidase [Myxococcota bacterium]MDW8283672.1 M20 family peptidase [Myxococcales bacterium]